MRIVFLISILLLTFTPAHAQFTSIDLKDGNGFVQVNAPGSAAVYIDGEKVGSVTEGTEGIIIENVEEGIRIVRVVVPGFEPSSWPVEVFAGKVAMVEVDQTPPGSEGQTNRDRLDSAKEYAESKLSTIKLNQIRQQMEDQNSKEETGGWGAYWNQGFRRKDRNPNDYDEWVTTSSPKYIELELLGEDGRRHRLRVERTQKMQSYFWDSGGFVSADFRYAYDWTAEFKFFMNDRLFHEFTCSSSRRSASHDQVLRTARNSSISTEEMEFDKSVYPVRITIKRVKLPFHGDRTTNKQMREGCQFEIKTHPLSF